MRPIVVPLPHFNHRPPGTVIDTLVIHAMYAPDCGTDGQFAEINCRALLDANKVASHYAIDRVGSVINYVTPADRAWHAGVSRMPFPHDAREGVNDFSIGVELIASPTSGFTDPQYEQLAFLTEELCRTFPIQAIVGHEEIAPGRKTDPGPLFDWRRYLTSLSRPFTTLHQSSL